MALLESIGAQAPLPGLAVADPEDTHASLGPAVIDHVPVYTSPTAIQKHRRCNRQWFFRYVMRLPDKPPGEGVKRGLAGHKRLEHYLKTGQNVLDPLEMLGIPWLPVPGPDLLVEHPFSIDVGAGFPVIGKIDLIDPRGGLAQWRVIDHKFKGDVEKWGSVEAELADPEKDAGVQMLAYAKVVSQLPNAPLALTLEHHQYQWKGRRYFEKVRNELPLSVAVERFDHGVRPELTLIRETAKQENALHVLGNESACRSYGGCPYLSQCFDPVTRLAMTLRAQRALKPEETKMALLAELPTQPAAPAAPVPTPPPPPTQVLPPDQPVPTRPRPAIEYQIDGKPVTEADYLAQSERDKMSRAAVLLGQTPATLPTLPTLPAVAAAGEEPAKRVRKRAATPTEASTEDMKALIPAPPSPPPPPVAAQATPPKPAPVGGGIQVYVGCAPIRTAAKSLLPIAQDMNDRIIAAAVKSGAVPEGITDIRACGENKVLGFMQWRSHLAELATEDLKAGRFPPGRYVVLESDERVKVLVDVLGANLPDGDVVQRVG